MVTDISSAKRAEIESKSVKGLPDTVTGKPDTVKNAIIEPVKIVVSEISRIVGDTNDSLKDCNNDIAENNRLIEKNKTDIQLNKTNIEKNKTDLKANFDKNKAEIDKVMKFADEHKFATEIVFDRSSSSSSINRGFPNGLKWKEKITGLELSKYRFLIIDCQFDRNLTMFMDLTEKNNPNGFYINSIAGTNELRGNFGFISFEIIIDLNKTSIHLNNISRSSDYFADSNLISDKDAYVSKIYGIK